MYNYDREIAAQGDSEGSSGTTLASTLTGSSPVLIPQLPSGEVAPNPDLDRIAALEARLAAQEAASQERIASLVAELAAQVIKSSVLQLT